jgi:hypothetical protein
VQSQGFLRPKTVYLDLYCPISCVGIAVFNWDFWCRGEPVYAETDVWFVVQNQLAIHPPSAKIIVMDVTTDWD